MIVNEGRVALQQERASYLATCYWALFTGNVADNAANTLSSYTEASFSGYARVLVGTMGAAALVSTRGQAVPNTAPVFTNSSGGGVTVYGSLLIAPDGTTLIDGHNFGAVTIPDGVSLTLGTAVSDTQE